MDRADPRPAATARSLSPAELAYYAGLGVLTVVELIEWPVALAAGAGTALARTRSNSRCPAARPAAIAKYGKTFGAGGRS